MVLRFAEALVQAGGLVEATAYLTSQLGTGYRISFLDWLAKRAEEQQDLETALEWWLRLFRERSSLESYLNVRKVAQRLDDWESLRLGLIEKLEMDQNWDLLIEIALEEGDVSRALELLPRQRWGKRDLQVAQAAEADHPQAAIEIYLRNVDRLIADRGRGNYHEAAAILQSVKGLYKHLDTQAEWERLIKTLRAQHARLPALQDELDKASL